MLRKPVGGFPSLDILKNLPQCVTKQFAPTTHQQRKPPDESKQYPQYMTEDDLFREPSQPEDDKPKEPKPTMEIIKGFPDYETIRWELERMNAKWSKKAQRTRPPPFLPQSAECDLIFKLKEREVLYAGKTTTEADDTPKPQNCPTGIKCKRGTLQTQSTYRRSGIETMKEEEVCPEVEPETEFENSCNELESSLSAESMQLAYQKDSDAKSPNETTGKLTRSRREELRLGLVATKASFEAQLARLERVFGRSQSAPKAPKPKATPVRKEKPVKMEKALSCDPSLNGKPVTPSGRSMSTPRPSGRGFSPLPQEQRIAVRQERPQPAASTPPTRFPNPHLRTQKIPRPPQRSPAFADALARLKDDAVGVQGKDNGGRLAPVRPRQLTPIPRRTPSTQGRPPRPIPPRPSSAHGSRPRSRFPAGHLLRASSPSLNLCAGLSRQPFVGLIRLQSVPNIKQSFFSPLPTIEEEDEEGEEAEGLPLKCFTLPEARRRSPSRDPRPFPPESWQREPRHPVRQALLSPYGAPTPPRPSGGHRGNQVAGRGQGRPVPGGRAALPADDPRSAVAAARALYAEKGRREAAAARASTTAKLRAKVTASVKDAKRSAIKKQKAAGGPKPKVTDKEKKVVDQSAWCQKRGVTSPAPQARGSLADAPPENAPKEKAPVRLEELSRDSLRKALQDAIDALKANRLRRMTAPSHSDEGNADGVDVDTPGVAVVP